MVEAAAERKTATIIFNDQGPSPLLARQSNQDMLRPAVPADVCQRLAYDSGDLAAGCGREAHLRRITDKLRADPGVLTITGDHAGEKINQMPGIEVQRLQL